MSGDSNKSDELLRRFKEGDPEAFGELTEPHVPALEVRAGQRLCSAMRKKVSVSDIVQEARMIAFERRADFESGGENALRNWLLGIVDNRAKDAVKHYAGTARRDIAREITHDLRPSSSELLGAGSSPSQHAAAAEMSMLTRQAMGVLSADNRELLWLVHEERLGLRDAAARLDLSYEATKKRHARALVELGHALARVRSDAQSRS